MKAVVGIDVAPESMHTVRLLGRLGFAAPQLELVHVVERLSPEEWANKPVKANDLLAQFLKMQEKEGQEWLDKAAALAREYNLPAESFLKYGSTAANQLLETAQNSKADLLAIGSRDESALGKLLIGSVGRKLVSNSTMSLCICRHEIPASTDGIDVVFATDHSDYASRCVDTLLKLEPRGIRRLTLMTAYPKQMVKTLRNFQPHVPADVSQWIEVHLEQQNLKAAERLSALGCDIQSRIMISDPDEAIDTVMRDTGSQLLIMGAQGRGFLKSLTTGSHTFRQAVSGKHSVLILREPH